MYNFFVDNNQINGNKVEILGDDYKHISRVLRMSVKEKISVSIKQTEERFLTEITSIDNEKVICTIIEKFQSSESSVNITIYQGIPKSDKMEQIIQKSVELGAKAIVPVEMKNCIAKIKDPDKKITRWQAISEAAAKQSKRNIIPKIEYPLNILEMYNEFNKYNLVLVAYENEKDIGIKEIFKKYKNAKDIAIIIGPEGGLTENEVKQVENKGGISVSLGKRILRTETASLALLSMIMYEFEM